MEKNSAFECGYSSFLGQNRTQFSVSFFIFALLFLLFDLEILLVYPYLVSAYVNEIYGLTILLVFLLALTLGFVFELGKKALTIDSRQTNHNKKKPMSGDLWRTHSEPSYLRNLVITQSFFTSYKMFNKNFWCVYLSTLKTKFTCRYIIFTLLIIIFTYCLRNYLQFLLDLDLSKFTDYAFIMAVTGALCKALWHFSEVISGESEMHKMPMGADNTINIVTPKKSSQVGYGFAMDSANDKNSFTKNSSNIPSNATGIVKSDISNHPSIVGNNNDSLDTLEKRLLTMPLEVRENVATEMQAGRADLMNQTQYIYRRIMQLDSPANYRRIDGIRPTMPSIISKHRTLFYTYDEPIHFDTFSNLFRGIEKNIQKLEEMSDKRIRLHLDAPSGVSESIRKNELSFLLKDRSVTPLTYVWCKHRLPRFEPYGNMSNVYDAIDSIAKKNKTVLDAWEREKIKPIDWRIIEREHASRPE